MPSDPVTDTDMPDTNATTTQRQLEKQGASTPTSSSSNTSKRRRISSLSIFDLPDIAFVRISSYLCTPSRALLALSLTTDSKSWRKYKWNNKKVSPILAWANVKRYEPSDQTKIIIASHKWESLDFGELNDYEETTWHMCKRLKDDDIAGVLACINAKDNLKTLKITGCRSISGRGLQLLLNSKVLRDIDLTHKFYDSHDNPCLLSEDFVLPIFESIINTTDNSLTLVQFPERWREAMSPNLHSFLVEYDRLLESRRVCCSKCNKKIWGNYLFEEGCQWINQVEYPINRDDEEAGYNYYGVQNFTCNKCVKFFCYDCDNGDDGAIEFHPMLNKCVHCKEEYCHDCVPSMTKCKECLVPVCDKCSTKCPKHNCEIRACKDGCSDEYILQCKTCIEEGCRRCTGFRVCDGEDCNITQCDHCFNIDKSRRLNPQDWLNHCESCYEDFCVDCRYSELSKDWGSACGECIELIADELGQKILKEKQDETAKRITLELKADQLNEEVKMLRKEIEDLKLPSKS